MAFHEKAGRSQVISFVFSLDRGFLRLFSAKKELTAAIGLEP
jgi:hypothetical protein